MSRDSITIPPDITDNNARHYYRTRMIALCNASDCIGSTDPSEISTHISPILDQARHIYAKSKRIQRNYNCRDKRRE